MSNLWSANTPASFWCCEPDPADELWHEAVTAALPVLELPVAVEDAHAVAAATLGEGQFGSDHWQLSLVKRTYYLLKPFLPRAFTVLLRQLYSRSPSTQNGLGWPVEPRYAAFLWEVMRQLLLLSGESTWAFRHFWPEGRSFAFVLTHDIETAAGQAYMRKVADLEEQLGFRSTINFIPERYPLDYDLMGELCERGFEIGVHGLKHDGKLFSTPEEFRRRAECINRYLAEFGAVGFRAPLTLRNPYWMQALDLEYDLSFFDTDPYEPLPGGCMSIWPFAIGEFLELPYTLAQDCTLTAILGETTPRLWLEKLEFIEQHFGLALVNTHPDYLLDECTGAVYAEFLQTMCARDDYYHALPCDVARWWRRRSALLPDPLPAAISSYGPEPILGQVILDGDVIVIQ
ncbi:MAG: hypothetical protein JW910_04160 [Anaerolineae bacterium]|nr:hypothetical protein [Anaerolineae bacterium]